MRLFPRVTPLVVGIAVVLLVVLLLMSSSADAKVVPFKAADGVKLGWTEQKVLDKVGIPTAREEPSPDGLRLTYRSRKLTVFLLNGEVVSVRTESRAQKSPTGIRVGISYRSAKKRLVGADCFVNNGVRACFVYREGYTFSFEAKRGKVTALEVGVLTD